MIMLTRLFVENSLIRWTVMIYGTLGDGCIRRGPVVAGGDGLDEN